MAFPPATRPSPGQRAAGRDSVDEPEDTISAHDALDALEMKASKLPNATQAQAAIKTLRSLFDVPAMDREDSTEMTPGRRAAGASSQGGSSAKSSAAARFGGR